MDQAISHEPRSLRANCGVRFATVCEDPAVRDQWDSICYQKKRVSDYYFCIYGVLGCALINTLCNSYSIIYLFLSLIS